jgi:hypothetical protein
MPLQAGSHPSVMWTFGASPVSPAEFLATQATVMRDGSPDQPVEMRKGRLPVEHYVAEKSTNLFNWIIMPDGFRAPHAMELARLQCWGFKPAARDGSSLERKKNKP